MSEQTDLGSESHSHIIGLTADIVSAYVAHNPVPQSQVPDLIQSTFSTLSGLGASTTAAPAEPLSPPVPIKKTVTPDHIISLEDGRPYKTLRRHLAGRGLTPEQYRKKWGLPVDYPMVAANYAATRSALAKNTGLGQRRRQAA